MLMDAEELDNLALTALRYTTDVSSINLTLKTDKHMKHVKHMKLQNALIIAETEPYESKQFIRFSYLQALMILVSPGKAPVTKEEKAMAQTSGHSIHLLPGDHQYDNPTFSIVIVSNGYRHYTPTQFAQSKSLLNWRLSLIGRHLSAAMDIFNVIEDDLFDTEVASCFQDLRINITQCQQFLGAPQKGTVATIPDVNLGPPASVATSSSRLFPQEFQPAPLIRRNLPLDAGLPETTSSGSTAVKSAGQKAPFKGPPQKTVVVLDKFFPAMPTKEVVFSEFNIPIDFTAIQVPVTQAVTTAVTIISSVCPSTATSSSVFSGPSTATTGSTTSTVTTVLGTVVSSQLYKRFNCQFCQYKTDRRQDFQNHSRTHEGVKIKCGHRGCRKSFWSNKSKRAHFKTVHMKKKRAQCHHVKCEYETNDYGCLTVHLYYEHGEGVEPKCPKQECKNRKFTNYRTYQRHLQSYHKPRDEQCPLCLRWYKGEENLNQHINEFHNGEDIVCDICGAKLSILASYKTHKSNMHRDDPQGDDGGASTSK